MKKPIIYLIILVTFIILPFSCKKCTRTGCLCKDNTTSNATGSGACSGHGGVKQWYEKCD